MEGTAMMTAGGLPAALPAWLQEQTANAPSSGTNSELMSGIYSGRPIPPRIFCKPGAFWAKIGDESKPIMKMNEDGEPEPVRSINVVIVAANQGTYRTYYVTKYASDSEDNKPPACYSYDGITPSPHSPDVQSSKCSTCPHSQYGSKINEKGNKAFACDTQKLLAILHESTVKKQAPEESPAAKSFMFKVSPTALNRNREDRKANPANDTSLAEYVDKLSKYTLPSGKTVEIPVTGVVTKIFFDAEAEYPLPRFKFVRFLDGNEASYVMARRGGSDVKEIVEEAAGAAPRLPAPVQEPETVARLEKAAVERPAQSAPAPEPVKAAKPPPVPEKAAEPDLGDAVAQAEAALKAAKAAAKKAAKVTAPAAETPAPAATQAAAPTAEPVVSTSAAVDDDLGDILAQFATT